MFLITQNSDFTEQRKLQRIFGVAKFGNLFVVSRLLFAEVVAREG